MTISNTKTKAPEAEIGRRPLFNYENLVLLLMVLVAGIAAADRLSFNIFRH